MIQDVGFIVTIASGKNFTDVEAVLKLMGILFMGNALLLSVVKEKVILIAGSVKSCLAVNCTDIPIWTRSMGTIQQGKG